MLLNLTKLYIVEDNTTDNSVELLSINEGVDGSSVFGFTSEFQELTIESGNTYVNRAENTLDIRTLKPSSSDFTQIKSWSDNQTDVYVAGLLVDGHLMFGDRATSLGLVKISINEQLTDSDVLALKITKSSGVGFSTSNGLYNGGMYIGSNALGITEFDDKDSSGLADSWSVDDWVTTFTSGAQNLTYSGGTVNRFRKFVLFPFEGQTATFSLNVTSFNEYGGDYAPRLEIQCFDASNSSTGSSTQNVNGTGVTSISLSIPANTIYIQVAFRAAEVVAGSQAAEFSVKDPMLSVFGNTTYTKF